MVFMVSVNQRCCAHLTDASRLRPGRFPLRLPPSCCRAVLACPGVDWETFESSSESIEDPSISFEGRPALHPETLSEVSDTTLPLVCLGGRKLPVSAGRFMLSES